MKIEQKDESSLFKKFKDSFEETAFSFRSIMSQKLLLLLLQISFITFKFRMYLSEEGDDGVVKGLASGHRIVVRYVVEW